MMHYVRKSEDRGLVDLGWLKSKHTFSFGEYFDPQHMGVSVLRVINDDEVMPGQGFSTHGHRDMEIISYVIDGALKHEDSSGNHYVVPAGEVQRMSAGSGVMHSEYNASNTDKVRFLQIWIQPNIKGTPPSYAQRKINQVGALTPLVTPNGEGDSLTLQQDASLFRVQLKAGESLPLSTANRIGYLHIIHGRGEVAEQLCCAGDGLAFASNEQLVLVADEDIEALWFDLPVTG